MRIHKCVAAWLLVASPVAAQTAMCVVGPGALFGVVGFQCTNCSFKQELGAPSTVTFFTEPVVTETRPGGALASGDVVIAVDGHPITTQLGADRFTAPGTGSHTLTVRRGRDRQELQFDMQTNCPPASASGGGREARGQGGGSGGGRASGTAGSASSATSNVVGGSGSNTMSNTVAWGGACDSLPGLVRLRGVARNGATAAGSDPLIIVDGVVVEPKIREREPGGRFGFALNTAPVCRVTQVDGKRRYRSTFDDYPLIYAVRPESAADKAGLRVGDAIVKVEGESVLEHPAWLIGSDDRNQLHMTVRRDGKEINVVMVATP